MPNPDVVRLPTQPLGLAPNPGPLCARIPPSLGTLRTRPGKN